MSELPPRSVIGVMGGGQLGRLLVPAAHELGYRLAVLDPDPSCPAGQVADFKVAAGLHERTVVQQFARAVQVLTFETEAFPARVLAEAEGITTVAPRASVLRTTSDRLQQRALLTRLRIPVPAFRAVHTESDLEEAADIFPARLKTASQGFDGRGQAEVRSRAEAQEAWERFGRVPCILECHIELAGEFSVTVARSSDGEARAFEPIRNVHRNGILHYSICPAGIDERQAEIATIVAISLAEVLDVVGLLCVEFFINAAGRVLVNEFAARPHNSGHLTIEAAETSQFGQLVRAVSGHPLGSTRVHSPAAMVNLLNVPLNGPPVEELARGVFLHRYGKSPRRNRKVGHITAVASTTSTALRLALDHAEAVANAPVAVGA